MLLFWGSLSVAAPKSSFLEACSRLFSSNTNLVLLENIQRLHGRYRHMERSELKSLAHSYFGSSQTVSLEELIGLYEVLFDSDVFTQELEKLGDIKIPRSIRRRIRGEATGAEIVFRFSQLMRDMSLAVSTLPTRFLTPRRFSGYKVGINSDYQVHIGDLIRDLGEFDPEISVKSQAYRFRWRDIFRNQPVYYSHWMGDNLLRGVFIGTLMNLALNYEEIYDFLKKANDPEQLVGEIGIPQEIFEQVVVDSEENQQRKLNIQMLLLINNKNLLQEYQAKKSPLSLEDLEEMEYLVQEIARLEAVLVGVGS